MMPTWILVLIVAGTIILSTSAFVVVLRAVGTY
jgi:hypothetical protein